MKRRAWYALGLIAIALGAAWLLTRGPRVQEIALPVLNRSDQPVQLLFYGGGLAEHVLVQQLAPGAGVVVTLRLSSTGAVHLKAESPRAQIDTLLTDNEALRGRPLQFEVREGNRFVLVPR